LSIQAINPNIKLKKDSKIIFFRKPDEPFLYQEFANFYSKTKLCKKLPTQHLFSIILVIMSFGLDFYIPFLILVKLDPIRSLFDGIKRPKRAFSNATIEINGLKVGLFKRTT